jgi:hypothetical protein
MLRKGGCAVALALAAVWVAGCTTPAPAVEPSASEAPAESASPPPAEGPAQELAPATVAAPGEVPPVMLQRGCHQYHTFFQVPSDGWEPYLPEGFAVLETGPGLTTIVGHASSCAEVLLGGAPAGKLREFWLSVEVTPPPELMADDVVFHAFALDAAVGNPTVAARYVAWGFAGPLEGSGDPTFESTSVPGLRLGRATADVDDGIYTLEVVVTERSTVGSLPGRVAVFAGSAEEGVTGHFAYAWDGWTDIGDGKAVLRYDGTSTAGPPALPGEAHEVEDVEQRVEGMPMAPA